MRCKTARKKLLHDELGLVSATGSADLAAHLESCPECAAWNARERALTDAIAALRVELPLAVDVSARVISRVSAADPGPANQLTAREAGWVSAVAFAFGTALVVGLWKVAPDLPLLAHTARAMLSGAEHIVTGLGAPLLAFVATLARSVGGTLRSFQVLYGPLQQLGPVAVATIALCTTMMAASILLVLGRDLKRHRWARENQP